LSTGGAASLTPLPSPSRETRVSTTQRGRGLPAALSKLPGFYYYGEILPGILMAIYGRCFYPICYLLCGIDLFLWLRHELQTY